MEHFFEYPSTMPKQIRGELGLDNRVFYSELYTVRWGQLEDFRPNSDLVTNERTFSDESGSRLRQKGAK